MKKWYVITGILALFLVISLGTCSSNGAHVERLKDDLNSLQTELNSAETLLAETETELLRLKAQLETKEPIVPNMTEERAAGDEYTVLKIDELVRVADIGGIEKYYRHTIKTKGGVVLSVDIGEKDFTVAKVALILLKAALNADEILALGE